MTLTKDLQAISKELKKRLSKESIFRYDRNPAGNYKEVP
jgi:hypothetical protein